MKIIKSIFIIILFCFQCSIHAQTLSTNEIKQMAQIITDELKDIDIGDGITFSRCIAINRTLIYQYDVNEYWSPGENMKEELIENSKVQGTAETFFNNNINVETHYYHKNKLLKKIRIQSIEFSNLNFNLGDYLSIKGHHKSKGVNLKIKPPVDWEVKEGNRPNIVKKFVYNNNSYTISIKNNITFISRNEARELLTNEEYVNELILEDFNTILNNAKILNHGIVTIDGYPALVHTTNGDIERSGIKMSVIVKNWTILYEDKIVMLHGGGLNNENFYALEKIYDLTTSSVIFPDRYNY